MIRRTALLSLLFTTTFSAVADNTYYDYYPNYQEKSRANHLYELKLGGGYAQTGRNNSTIPYIAIGDRIEIGDGAAIEISIAWGEHNTESGNSIKYSSFPKICYITSYNHTYDKSFYYGGGVSWSSVRYHASNPFEPNSHFRGIFAEGVLGYELGRSSTVRTMLELNVSQPMISNSKSGNHPGPTFILSLNFGF